MLITHEEVGGALIANAKYAPGLSKAAVARNRNES
jgi:hypothetical protein